MHYWSNYVKAGWELVMEAQGASSYYLTQDMELFLVHVIARTFEKTNIWDEPIAIKLMTAQTLPKHQKQSALRTIGEECLFIDAWEIKQNRWPSPAYFHDMGKIAFGFASIASHPIDQVLESASNNFLQVSKILRYARDLHAQHT